MRTTAFRVSRRSSGGVPARSAGRVRRASVALLLAGLTGTVGLATAAPSVAFEPASAPAEAAAPECVHLYAGLRYTHLHSECGEDHRLRVHYTFGEASDCRLVTAGGWHTFRGYGFDGDHPVAVEPCED
ncbi:alpha-amylase [Streptomyces sp. ST2-7A]|uniref:alpha-amylase n=1 Tax=Streptomyces sp. ST2-7A TaxID=2907214 RepID=UPI001F41456A|nr:alpha-amylase [Streptomyces sp. ST2-7A]MCE7082541.1 alpha-amylase [Streptomyces sp. ST2-7A]